MNTVLFVPYYDGHIRVFAPVIRRLKEQVVMEPLVVFLERVHGSQLQNFLIENNLPYTSLDLSSYSAEEGRSLAVRAKNAINFPRFLSRRRKEISAFFTKINPAFVVTATDGFRTDADFLYEAKRRKIPSLCLFSVMTSPSFAEEVKKRVRLSFINGTYRKILSLLGLPVHAPSAPSRGYATRVSVWSEKHRAALLERSGIADKIVVTGSPAHDVIYQKLHQPVEDVSARIHQQLGIDQDKQIILYTSQPVAVDGFCSFEEQRRLTELIIETCGKFDEYTLVIKLHPRESVDEYSYLETHPEASGFRLVSEKDSDLYDLIWLARVLLTQSSTTGLDAVLFDKDMIVIDILLPVQDPMSYIKSGAALGVYREQDLLPALKKILSDKTNRRRLKDNREKFAAEYAGKFDGKSAHRVVELISEMLTEGR